MIRGRDQYLSCQFLLCGLGLFIFSLLSAGPAFGLGKGDDDIFIRVRPSKAEVFLGEPVDISYLLYSSVSAMEPERNENLEFPNCFSKAYPAEKREWKENIQGKTYTVMVLKKYVVIPFKLGSLAIPRLSVQLKVTLPAAKDDFFEQEISAIRELSSLPLTLVVNPLPAVPASSPFSNAIGDFKLETTYREVKGILYVKLRLEGRGNLKSAEIKLPDPAGLEAFNREELVKDTLLSKGLDAVYTLSYQLLAKYRGTYTINGTHMLVFDPGKRTYVSIPIPAYTWKVTAGPDKIPSSVYQKDTQDVLYVMDTEQGHHFGDQYFLYTRLFDFMVLTSAAALMLSWWYRRKAEDKAAHPAKYNHGHAFKIAMRSLKIWGKKAALSQPDRDDSWFLRGLLDIFSRYLCARYALRPDEFILSQSFALPQSGGHVAFKDMPAELYENTAWMLQEVYRHLFAGTEKYPRSRKADIRLILTAIKKIESVS